MSEAGQNPAALFLPHPEIVLKALGITRSRLDSKARIPIRAAALKLLLEQLITALPFDEEAYLALNPDVAKAHKAGSIVDLRQHFISSGYLEGRFASPVHVDEEFYLKSYPDVADAIRNRKVASATEHYTIGGVVEGRIPTKALEPMLKRWLSYASMAENLPEL